MIEASSAPPPARSRARDAALLQAAVTAGPGVRGLRLLDRVDPGGLDAGDRVTLLRAWERFDGWLTVRRAAAVLAVAGPEPDPDEPAGDRPGLAEIGAEAEVAAAARLAPSTAGARIDTARFVAGRGRECAGLLASGDWGIGHLRVAESELALASPAVTHAVLVRVRPFADTDTPGRLRARLRRALTEIDADAIRARIRAQARNRAAGLTPEPDLRGCLTITGPWDQVAWGFRQLDAWARREQARLRAARRAGTLDPGAGDPAGGASAVQADESLAALRADAFTAAALLLARSMGQPGTDLEAGVDPDAASGPGRGRSWSTAIVVVDAATALGLAQAPGWVPGYGFVPAPVARELAASADTWRRFLVDDTTRRLIDTGRTRYRPGRALRDLVTARDLTCTFDPCGRPATATDIDHIERFDGSNTTAANTHPACRAHHNLKTHAGWTVWRDLDGRSVWVSPTGQRVPHQPDPRWQPPDPPPREPARVVGRSRPGQVLRSPLELRVACGVSA